MNDPWKEIREANDKSKPCIHGLLQVLAFNVFKSPERTSMMRIRLLYEKNNERSDWLVAQSLLARYVDDFTTASAEDYLKREISFIADRNSKQSLNRDQYSNWMTAVNEMADRVFNRAAAGYFDAAA